MKTLAEIHAEAKNFAPDNEAMQDAFVQGARYALTSKYYKEADAFAANTDTEVILRKLDVPTFEEWWCCYQKKRGRKKAEAKWNKLSAEDRQACMNATPAYVASTPDVQYRLDPLTYLNGERWNDTIYQKPNYEQQRAQQLAERTENLINSAYRQ